MRSIKVRYAALSAAILAALGLALAAIFLPGKPAQAQSPVQSADYQQQEPVPPSTRWPCLPMTGRCWSGALACAPKRSSRCCWRISAADPSPAPIDPLSFIDFCDAPAL